MTKPDIHPPATLADLCKATGFNRNTVVGLIKAGKLPGHKYGTKWRIPWGEFESWYRGEWEPAPDPRPADEQPDPVDFLKRRSA